MSDYRTQPLSIAARSTGGADVDVSATLLVDGLTDQDGDVTLVDVHRTEKRASLRALASGKTKLRLIYVVVPLVGNGQFAVTVTLSHPAIENSPLAITRTGDLGDGGPKTYSTTYVLP